MFKYFLIALLFISQNAFSSSQCFIVKNLKDNKILKTEGQCEERTTPASTFKIPLGLMGFDSGIFTSATQPEWKYAEKHAENAWGEPCKVPQSPASWIKNSCVWYSQELVAKLGKEKFQHYVDIFNYGNKDITGDPGENNGLKRSWIGSSLKISPNEQIEFLSKLIQNQLPVSRQSQELIREILFVEVLPEDWKLYGKTGMAFQKDKDGTRNSKRQFGWYVGWVSKGDDNLVFAYRIKDEEDQTEPAGLRAKKEGIQQLKDMLHTTTP